MVISMSDVLLIFFSIISYSVVLIEHGSKELLYMCEVNKLVLQSLSHVYHIWSDFPLFVTQPLEGGKAMSLNEDFSEQHFS